MLLYLAPGNRLNTANRQLIPSEIRCTLCNGRRYLDLPEGLEITEVMRLASYSKYATTLKYYPAVKDDLVDRARRAVGHRVSREMLEKEV